MKLKPETIVPSIEKPFEKDLLKREQYANVLSQIVKNSEDGFTLSINADWGYGKTTFVKMWEALLQSEGYKTIYFNAWESDFVADPMMALIDGLREGFDEKDLPQEKLQLSQALWKAATKLIKLVPQFRVVGEVAEIFQNGINDCLEDKNELQEHHSYQQLVRDFKEQLSTFAKDISENKQVIVFVDELDRCRPDYAVQMLERIKHFFSIDNIIFVLSIDKSVLCKSIRAVYGGLDIDTEAYLRRFVDLDFDLPEPNVSDFIEAQYKKKGLSEYFTGYWDYNSKTWGGEDREKKLKRSIWDCLLAQSNSLRDIEKYFNRLEIILNSKDLSHSSSDLIAYLLFLYMFHRDVYEQLRLLDTDVPNMWGSLVSLINTPYIDRTSELYGRCYGLTIKCIASYIIDMEFKDQYCDPVYKTYRDGSGLDWLPESDRRWMEQEINNPHRMMLKDLFPHFELINARFDFKRAE